MGDSGCKRPRTGVRPGIPPTRTLVNLSRSICVTLVYEGVVARMAHGADREVEALWKDVKPSLGLP